MKFKADEIASVIQREIQDFRGEMETREVGRVLWHRRARLPPAPSQRM